MVPVSPCFYTNMPGHHNNWLWRGDSPWVNRWNQLISGEFQPKFPQIISWNNYGESHYIASLDDLQYAAFRTGRTPYNTASQLQVEVAPSVMIQDEIYFAAPLGSAATISVTIGGVEVAST
jgi:hypothetical protein